MKGKWKRWRRRPGRKAWNTKRLRHGERFGVWNRKMKAQKEGNKKGRCEGGRGKKWKGQQPNREAGRREEKKYAR